MAYSRSLILYFSPVFTPNFTSCCIAAASDAVAYELISQFSKIKIQVVHFTSDTEWFFWDNMIFSNGDNKWEKKLNTFAGQSGDGKSTQIVMGGKYEKK